MLTLWVWMINMLLLGVLAGMVLERKLGSGGLELVFARSTIRGPREQDAPIHVFGVQLRMAK